MAYATVRLAATGEREQALFVLMIDPLWKAELGLATLLGNAGTLRMMNALGLVAWGAAFLFSIALVWRLRRRQSPMSSRTA